MGALECALTWGSLLILFLKWVTSDGEPPRS